jgi:hypothetical protein
MSATKSPSLLFPAGTNVPAGTTRASPVIGNVIDLSIGYGGVAHAKITNGASPPTAGGTIEIQASPDNVLWTFYDQMLGDSAAGSGGTASIPVDKGVKYLRAIAFGNTVNAVTVDGQFTHVTGL